MIGQRNGWICLKFKVMVNIVFLYFVFVQVYYLNAI